MVISESAAIKYFGSANPIGKILLRGSDKTATEVTGVVEETPSNSHIRYDMVLSGESWEYMRDNQWTSNNIYTYLKFQKGADLQKFKSQLDALCEKNMGAEIEQYLGMTFEEFKAKGDDLGLSLQPMLDIHLKSDRSEEILPNGNLQYIYIFIAIAAFIVLIACINFMNLATARSANRAKEVGVRKTIGAFRLRLVGQFLAESMIYSFLSTILALALMGLLLQPFNELAGKTLDFSLFSNPIFILGILSFTIIVGLMAGSYPAFYLTAFNPVDVLKGKVRAGFKNSRLRNSLVIFQFIISIALILGSLVVYKQLQFMQEKNMGFNKENVINLLHTFSLGKNAKPFKDELNSHTEFEAASFANTLPPNISWTSVHRKGGSEQDYLLSVYQVDHDHLAAMGYTMAEGRFFSRDFPTDSMAIILNETAFKQMGFDKVEGSTVLTYSYETPRPLTLIGVVKDFNFESLRNSVKPMAIVLGREPNGEMAIRLAAGNTQEQIKLLETIWKKHSSNAFEYSFLDQNFDALFRAEQRMSHIIVVFTVLTISIACLGLFGLATFVGEQRAKKISIRKVMGASMPQVVVLLLRDFTSLILIAFVIAAPLGWYFMNGWLEGFAFHASIDPWIIFVSGLASLLIALVTISFQSLKAARENPVKALKME